MMILIWNQSLFTKIKESNIPNDCKHFYIALTLFESGWHKHPEAIKKHNYSGFKEHNKLKTFESETEYVEYFQNWFIRKKIYSEKSFKKYILSGKYNIASKKQLVKYLNDILKIKKRIKKYDNFRKPIAKDSTKS